MRQYSIASYPALGEAISTNIRYIVRSILSGFPASLAFVLGFAQLALVEMSHSQQLALRTYNRSSGLASNYIFSIFQDRDGFMWFGTDRGVSMFDGHQFRNYSTANGLSSNLVYRIFQSSDGKMWFTTYRGGACSFDGIRYKTYSTKEGLPDSTIQWVAEDRFGRIYLQSANGIGVLFNDSISVLRSSEPSGINLMMSLGGSICYVSRNGLSRITPTNNHQIVSHDMRVVPSQPPGFWSRGISSVVIRRNGEVWLGGYNSIIVLELAGKDSTARLKKNITMPGSIPTVYGMSEENDSTVWAATRIGLFRITDNALRHFKKEEGIEPEFLQSMCRDHEGTLWLGTFGGGAKRLSNDHMRFFTLKSGLPTENISSIFSDSKGNVWLGGNGFLGMLNTDGKLVFRNSSFAEVRAIAETPGGKMLVGTFEFLYGPAEPREFRRSFGRQEGIRIGGGVSTIYFDSLGGRWSGSYGVGTYHVADGKTRHYNEADGMPSQMVEGIVPGYNSLWFLSRDNGASRLKDGVFERFSLEQGLPSNEIFSLLEDAESIWFGTGKGLARMHRGRVSVIDEKAGLQGNSVLWMGRIEGESDALWILTESSLNQLRNGELRSFGSTMLRPSPTASVTEAVFRSSDRSLWVATTGGVSQIDLDRIEQNQVPPSVRIMRLMNDTTLVFSHMRTRALGRLDAIELAHNQNNISISFAGLSYVDEEDVRYRFKLEPLEDDWSALTKDREVRYRNLDDGSYTFSVLAINGNNVLSASPATISFRILPPLWERWWFLWSVVVLIAGTFGGIVRYISVRKLRKKVDALEREQAIHAERERISRDLHDHVGAQLVNIISGLDLVGKYSPPTETRAQRLLKSLQQDARSSMLQLRETIWAMKTQSMTLERLASQIEEYSRRQMELHDAVKMSFDMPRDAALELTPTQSLNSFRFVQEALANCLKHAKASHIRVSIWEVDSGRVCISVKDDGVGIRHQATGSLDGNGIANMRRRAEELGGTFSLESDGMGTEASFTFPVRTDVSGA